MSDVKHYMDHNGNMQNYIDYKDIYTVPKELSEKDFFPKKILVIEDTGKEIGFDQFKKYFDFEFKEIFKIHNKVKLGKETVDYWARDLAKFTGAATNNSYPKFFCLSKILTLEI